MPPLVEHVVMRKSHVPKNVYSPVSYTHLFLGFELTDLGGGSYAINGVPAGIEGLNPIDLIQNMVHTAMEKGGKVKEEVQSILALTLAKAAAIVPGQVLTNEEMKGLVDGLFAVATPNYTPDGKTVLSVINEDDLEKLFK